MAEGKKGFVLYCDLIHTVRKMPKEKAGELLMTILSYVNDENPAPGDLMVDLVFEPIKQQLKRDLKKWEGFIEKQRLNGLKGGRPSVNPETQKSQAFSEKPKKAVTGKVTVTDKVTVSNTLPPAKNIFNAEDEILKNPIEIERICMAANFPDKNLIKEALHKFHLYLESNDRYPQTKKQIFSGFEKWILNEKKFSNGSQFNQSGNAKLGTSAARIKAAGEF